MSKKLTKKEAVAECKKLWQEIEASGKSKRSFLDSPEGKVWLEKNYQNSCPLCEYAKQKRPVNKCRYCPLVLKYKGGCYSLGFKSHDISSPEWFEAIRNL